MTRRPAKPFRTFCLLSLLLLTPLQTLPAGTKAKTGVILRVSGRYAIISLGSREKVSVGTEGVVFREEKMGDQLITSNLADLFTTEVYPDSAMVEIRRQISPISAMNKIRVEVPGGGGMPRWVWYAASGAAGATVFEIVRRRGGTGGGSGGGIAIDIVFP